MKKPTFNEFCDKYCDRLYNPRLPLESQSTGYLELRKMVINNTEPVTMKEMKRWETNPTTIELMTQPDVKYLRFLHPLLRPFIIDNWEFIKTLKID